MNTAPPIIIAGIHRSGTSLLARILAEMGLHIGTKLDSHRESVLFKRINNQLLKESGATWNSPEPFLDNLKEEAFVESQAQRALSLFQEGIREYGEVETGCGWGWKDPRNILTLPIWLAAFPDAKVIFIERHGIDVALSLQRREFRRIPYALVGRAKETLMFPPTLRTGYQLWCLYSRAARDLQQKYPNWISIRYEDLISEPKKHMTTLQKFICLDVTPTEIEQIAKRVVRRPTSRSRFEDLCVRVLLRLHLLNPEALHEAGYETRG